MNDNQNYNPFLDDDQQKKEKTGLFGKKENEEQQVTTLTLKEVQNMTFPTEEEKAAEQPVVPQGPTVEQIQEKRRNLRKSFLKVRNIVEIVVFVVVVFVLFINYRSYSAKTNQQLTYQFKSNIFELYRVKEKLYVVEKVNTCEGEVCKEDEVKKYDIKYGKLQTFMIHLYFDITFKLKNGRKSITERDLNTSLSSKAVYSMIHHDPKFLTLKQYRRFEVLDFEQKSDYTVRGYQNEETQGHFYLTVALGTKEAMGYNLEVYEVHRDEEGNVIVYIQETEPDISEEKWINASAPRMNIEIDEKPASIQVINVQNGEVFKDYKEVFSSFQDIIYS